MAKQDARKEFKRYWKEARAFLKDDKSMWSWLANLAIAFVIIKFIVYPGLGLLFGASLPVVAVVSSSMDHGPVDGRLCGVPAESVRGLDEYWIACGAWYEARGISKAQFATYPFKNGFYKGDIMVILGPGRVAVDQGDILVFEAAQRYPIIHRIVNISVDEAGATYYQTKGDHNSVQIRDYVVGSGQAVSRCHQKGSPVPCPFGVPVTADTPGAKVVFDEAHVTQDQVIGTAVFRIPLLGWVKIWFSEAIGWFVQLF